MTKLKICGLRPGDDLSFTEDAAVHYVGIIFAKNSRRYVSPHEAKFITKSVNASCGTIGVFVNSSVADVLQTAEMARLDGVQLHGNETEEDCQVLRESGLTVWKSVTARGRRSLENIQDAIQRYSLVTDGILLDAPVPRAEVEQGVTGGFGIHFDCTLLPLVFDSDRFNTTDSMPPIWIAGGVTPENVDELHKYWHPYGVDVSSGVETNGRKSTQRISDMIKAVKRLD